MNDKQAFQRVMALMGMRLTNEQETKIGTLIEYDDDCKNTQEFTKKGYDEFYAGAIFNDKGEVVKGYIDSHAALTSGNCDEIEEIKKGKAR